jgi:hypothetical protein
MSNRLDQEREKRLQPIRLQTAKKELTKLGLEITFEVDAVIHFVYKGETIKYFPYTGWHTGKGIKDGRGLKNLLKQLK